MPLAREARERMQKVMDVWAKSLRVTSEGDGIFFEAKASLGAFGEEHAPFMLSMSLCVGPYDPNKAYRFHRSDGDVMTCLHEFLRVMRASQERYAETEDVTNALAEYREWLMSLKA